MRPDPSDKSLGYYQAVRFADCGMTVFDHDSLFLEDGLATHRTGSLAPQLFAQLESLHLTGSRIRKLRYEQIATRLFETRQCTAAKFAQFALDLFSVGRRHDEGTDARQFGLIETFYDGCGAHARML